MTDSVAVPAADPVTVTEPVEVAIGRVRAVYGGWRRDTPIARMREEWDRLFPLGIDGAVVEPALAGDAGARGSQWVSAAGADASRVVLYFHGGGYKLGSPRSHLDLMARISQAARCRVLGLAYRLAPEHRFPAPIEDAVGAYRWLLQSGIPAHRIALAGDSAGGGLAAATLLALRARGVPAPAAAVMLSAWTDLTAEADSYATSAAADPIHQRSMIMATARSYLGESGNPRDPLASPLFGDPAGFPPLLIQVGDRETVLDDSTRFAQRARAAGVEVELEVYANMIHVFQQFADLLPEARRAIDSIGRFLNSVWTR